MTDVDTDGTRAIGRTTRRWKWRVLAALAVLVLVGVTATVVQVLRGSAPAGYESAGDEFDTEASRDGTKIGWTTPQDVGTVFTDATAYLTLLHGSVTIASVDATLTGSSVERVGEPMVAQMLPTSTGFPDTLPEFPPRGAKFAHFKLGPLTVARGATLSMIPQR
jgi:hypothetical protein